MKNAEVIKWGSEISKKTSHELIGMLYQRIEEMRVILSILNKREEEQLMKPLKIMKKIKFKKNTQKGIIGNIFCVDDRIHFRDVDGQINGKERKTKRRAKTKTIELKPKEYLPKSRFFKT